MISPYEFLALVIVLPIVAAGVWIVKRYDTDGAPSEAFEAWCRAHMPILFAARVKESQAAKLHAALVAAVGAAARVEHRSGRYPWTRYVFSVEIEVEAEGVVVVRATRAKIRLL